MIDGKLDGWVGAARVRIAGERLLALPQKADPADAVTSVSAAYDDKGLYLAVRVQDATPMANACDPDKNPGEAWMDDCLQLRFNVAGADGTRMLWVDAWYSRSADKPALRIIDKGPNGGVSDGLQPDATGHSASLAFQQHASGDGYTQELFLPWSRLQLDTVDLVASRELTMGLEIVGGKGVDSGGFHLRGLVADPQSNTDGYYKRPELWGTLILGASDRSDPTLPTD